jgi:hypothetical protein
MEEKVSLPIKTKIAAWWMIVIGGLIILFFPFIAFISFVSPPHGIPSHTAIAFFMAFIFFIGSFFLFGKRKWAWWLIIFTFSFGIAYSLFLLCVISLQPSFFYSYYWPHFEYTADYFLFLLLFFPPFILLLLDRKNFWKVGK